MCRSCYWFKALFKYENVVLSAKQVQVQETGHSVRSLRGAEGSAHLQVVVDVAISGAGLGSHVRTGTVSSSDLNVDVREIIEGEGLALSSVKSRLGLVAGLKEALSVLFVALRSRRVVKVGQELVVL